jgi:undecaprenyl-diphosphatase
MMTIDHHSGMEEALFRALNADGGRVLDILSVVLSARWFGMAVGASILIVIMISEGPRRRELLLAFAVALILSDVVGSQVLRPLIGRMRPCFALPAGTVRWLAPASDVGSLPSLHAAHFLAMSLVACWGRPPDQTGKAFDPSWAGETAELDPVDQVCLHVPGSEEPPG